MSKKNKNNERKLDRHVLEILVCPLSKTRLILSADKSELISLVGRIAFPIKNGIPLLSVEESRDISEEEYISLK